MSNVVDDVVSHACLNVLIKYLLMFVGFNFFFRARSNQFATVFHLLQRLDRYKYCVNVVSTHETHTSRIGGSRSTTRTHNRSLNIIQMTHIRTFQRKSGAACAPEQFQNAFIGITRRDSVLDSSAAAHDQSIPIAGAEERIRTRSLVYV